MVTKSLYTTLANSKTVNFESGYVTKDLRRAPKYQIAEVKLADYSMKYVPKFSRSDLKYKIKVKLGLIIDDLTYQETFLKNHNLTLDQIHGMLEELGLNKSEKPTRKEITEALRKKIAQYTPRNPATNKLSRDEAIHLFDIVKTIKLFYRY